MWICPTCNRILKTEEEITQHSLKCWKQHNPNHKSKSAPHSEDIVDRQINNELAEFFTKGINK